MKFSYLIGEGFKNVFKNKKSAVTSLVTMICAMFLFGIFFAIGENINYVLEQVQRSQGMEVFIWDEVTDEQRDRFENEIKSLDGVNTVTYKNKQQALESMKERMPGNSDLWAGYEGENNIFPASFEVTLTDLEKNEEIQRKAAEIGKELLSEEKVDEEIAKMAEMYKMEVEKLKEYMGEAEKEQMKADMAVQEAVTLLVDSAVEE